MNLKSRGIAWKGGGSGRREEETGVGNEGYNFPRTSGHRSARGSVAEEDEEGEKGRRSELKVVAHSTHPMAQRGRRWASAGTVASLIFILAVACVVDIEASDSEHKNQNCKYQAIC